MSRGDLLFYRAPAPKKININNIHHYSVRSLIDILSSYQSRLISLFTNGLYSHVAIDAGDGTVYEAVSSGIVHRPGGTSRTIDRALTGQFMQAEACDDAFTFLDQHVGRHYGNLALVDAGLKLLGIPFRVGTVDEWDCSSLATRFLSRALDPDDLDLGELADDPDAVSPNDLRRWCDAKGVPVVPLKQPD